MYHPTSQRGPIYEGSALFPPWELHINYNPTDCVVFICFHIFEHVWTKCSIMTFSNEFYFCMCILFYINTNIHIDIQGYHFSGKKVRHDIMQWDSMSLIYFSMDLEFDQREENFLLAFQRLCFILILIIFKLISNCFSLCLKEFKQNSFTKQNAFFYSENKLQ